MGSVLPEGWKQVCTKGHAADHSTKCTNWICPQGRRYKDWSDVQAYFQLLYFEEDIPGLECRPENAKKCQDAEEEEEVTLEEATKNEMEAKTRKAKQVKVKEVKRKRTTTPASDSSDSEVEAETVEIKKKGRKKNKDDDDDYKPEEDPKKSNVSADNIKKSPKKTRRSVAAAKVEAKENVRCTQCKSAFLSSNDLQSHIKTTHKVKDVAKTTTTLDETPDISKKSVKTVPMSKKAELGVDKIKKSESEPAVSEVINLDSPVKDDVKAKIKDPSKSTPSRSISIVKIDEDVKEVKSSASIQNQVSANVKDDSIKSSTQKLYDTRFELFKEFCAKSAGGVDPMKATSASIDKFLQHLQKEKNLGKSVLNGYKSAIIKIQSDFKAEAKIVESKPLPQPITANPPVLAKTIIPLSSKATITPVQPIVKPVQTTAAKSLITSQSMTPPPQPKPTPVQQQTSQGRPKPQTAQQNQKQTRDSTPQNRQGAAIGAAEESPQIQKKQTTPQSQARVVQQATPQTRQQQQNLASQQAPQANPRQQTPQSNPRQQTPQSNPRQPTPQSNARQQTPQSNAKLATQSNPRQQTPHANPRQTTPQSNLRQPTPQSGTRQQVPQANSAKQQAAQPQVQVRQQPQSGTPRAQTPRPRQQVPQVRGIQPSIQPRQGTPQPRQQLSQTRQQTPQPRQQRPQTAQNTPQGRQQQVKSATPQQQAPSIIPQFTEMPAYLKSLVNFPCKLETNAGGGPSLYRAASQHTGLGQDGWQELRKYCHSKLVEWWQWYQPYYTFPLQVKIRMRNQTVQKTIPSNAEFVKFLKTEESLYSFHMSECELYCLANILGVPVYQLTYNLVGVGGKPEERCRWDTLDPHQGLIHQNKFNSNKEPLYILYEDKIHFCRIFQTK